jgi:hypothetical protein
MSKSKIPTIEFTADDKEAKQNLLNMLCSIGSMGVYKLQNLVNATIDIHKDEEGFLPNIIDTTITFNNKKYRLSADSLALLQVTITEYIKSSSVPQTCGFSSMRPASHLTGGSKKTKKKKSRKY